MASLEEIYGTGSPFKLPSSPMDTQRPGAIIAQAFNQLPLMYLMAQKQKGEDARQDTLIGLKEDALNQEFNIATMRNKTAQNKIDQDWDINMYKGDREILGYMSEYLSPEYMEQFLVGTRDNMKTTEGKALLNKDIGVSKAAQPGFDAKERLKEIDHIGITDMETANEAYELSKIAPGPHDYYNDNIKKKVEKFKVTQANVTGFASAYMPLLNDNQQTLLTGMLVNPHTSQGMIQSYINTSLTQNIQSKASDRQASRDLLGNIDTLIKSREAEYKTYTDENLRQGRYLQILEETKTIDNPDGDAQAAAEKLAIEEGALATSISGLRGVLNTALEQGMGFHPLDDDDDKGTVVDLTDKEERANEYVRSQWKASGTDMELMDYINANKESLSKGLENFFTKEVKKTGTEVKPETTGGTFYKGKKITPQLWRNLLNKAINPATKTFDRKNYGWMISFAKNLGFDDPEQLLSKRGIEVLKNYGKEEKLPLLTLPAQPE